MFGRKRDKVVRLPSSEEIMKRLRSVYNDDYTAENFYPLIAQAAGRELVAEGVVMMLAQKIHDFVSRGYPPVAEGILHGFVPSFIDALVDDREVAKAAKAFHKKALEAAQKK